MIFLNSASSAAALVFHLPGVCTHTDTEGKQRKARVRHILKSSEKTHNENTKTQPTDANLAAGVTGRDGLGHYSRHIQVNTLQVVQAKVLFFSNSV